MARGVRPLVAVGWLVLALTGGAACLAPAGLAAQERVPVTVDYVGGDGVYLAVGADEGLANGDTLLVYGAARDDAPVGRIVLVSVTRRRTVARPLDEALSLQRGDVVFLDLSLPSPATAEAVGSVAGVATSAGAEGRGHGMARPGGGVQGVVESESEVHVPNGRGGGVRVDGRIALDVEARETYTEWTGDLSGETRRRFATPSTRLSLNVSQLPGGFTVRANLRASYRYQELSRGLPSTSIRAYELSAGRTFEAIPLELRLGRFHNPYERYSSYWDGLLLRVGRARGPGVGAVAGFEPTRADEGPSSQMPRVTAFADFRSGGRGWRYDTDLSVHMLRPSGLENHLYAGWSQRLRVGPLTLDQRARADRSETDRRWSLTQLRLRGEVRVGGPFRLRGGYARRASGFPFLEGWTEGPVREEIQAGLGVRGRGGWLAADGGRTRWSGEDGWAVTALAGLRLGRGRLLLSGRRWWRGAMESLSIAPGASVSVAGVRARIGYRHYRTDGLSGILTSHAADAQVSFALGRLYHLTTAGLYQWGRNLNGTRVRVGVWRSF